MKILLYGFIFGLILPVIGLFVGLQVQVSPLFAYVLMFPIMIISDLFNQPFGYLSPLVRNSLFIFSGIFWAAIFFTIHKIKNKLDNN